MNCRNSAGRLECSLYKSKCSEFTVLMMVLLMYALPGHAQHRITEIFNVVDEPQAVSWATLQNESLDFGDAGGEVRVEQGIKVGGRFGIPSFSSNDVYFPSDEQASVIEISADMDSGNGQKGVQGIWEGRLPLVKHVQMEVAYDLLADAQGNPDPGRVSLVVYVRDLQGESWVPSGVFGKESNLIGHNKVAESNLNSVQDIKFTTNSFLADLCPWSGDYIRLVFEVCFDDKVTKTAKIRLLKGRLVTSTFKVVLGEEQTATIFQGNRLYKSVVSAAPTATLYPTETDMSIENLWHWPEGFSIEELSDGSYMAYFGGVVGNADKSTGVFHVEDESFRTISQTELTESLVRYAPTPASTPYPRATGTPYPALEPEPNVNYQLDTYYAGAGGAVFDGTRMHVVYHAEDKAWDGTLGGNNHHYIRIGYARADLSGGNEDGYTLKRLAHGDSSADPTPVATPISGTHYGGWGNAIITAASPSESAVYTKYPPPPPPTPNPHPDHWGVGHPCLIKHSNYYYLFYYHHGWNDYSPLLRGIMVARAFEDDIEATDATYQNADNPWHKWNGSNWAQPGIGGTDYAIIHDRHSPSVSYNEYLDMWIMFTVFSDSTHIYGADNLTGPWSGIQIDTYEHATPRCVAVTEVSSYTEKITNQFNKLYYISETEDGNEMMYKSIRFIQ